MAEKNIKSRITHKHDVEANWLLAVNFTPKQGEIIIYDIDDNYTYERFKIGDGISNVNDLPFAGENNSIILDTTLTQEGVAADAKAVGDALDALDTIIAVDENNDGNIELSKFLSGENVFDGVMTTDLNMSGYKIVGLAEPSNYTDVTTKGYVDNKRKFFSVTLAIDNWVGDAAPYTQTITVGEILETDTPHYGPVYSDNVETALLEKENWVLVDDLNTENGSVTFTCFTEKPVIDITVQMEVHR